MSQARARALDVDEAGRLVVMVGLLADPTRERILYALDVVEEPCVGDIAVALDATEDSVGYGLRVLRTASLVTFRKQAGLCPTASRRASRAAAGALPARSGRDGASDRRRQ